MSSSENMIKCPKCNTYNEAGSRFCESCGNKLEQEAPAFAPVKDETPAFAPAKDETPAFAPAKDETPAFAPAKDKTPAFAPTKDDEPAFAPAKDKAPAFVPVGKPVESKKEVQPAPTEEIEDSVFAQGLPEWDIIPPQVVVRRKKK